MTNPRANITRHVLTPPPRPVDGVAVADAQATDVSQVAEATAEGRLIGKRHGNMRSVGLLLTRPARAALYQAAKDLDVTLGEALVEALRVWQASVPPTVRRPAGRTSPRIRRGADTSMTYVLLTPPEARLVSAVADDRQLSISALASQALADTSAAVEDGA